MSRLLKWEKNGIKQRDDDLDWVVRDERGMIMYRVSNNWHFWGDTKIHAIFYKNYAPELYEVESPKAGIRWCEAHYVLCR